MSPSFHIRKRLTSRGAPRWEVRWRPGGRESNWRSLGTFSTERDARARRQWAQGELAAGRWPNPRRILEAPRTWAGAVDAYGATHTGRSARKRHTQARARLGRLADMPAESISGRDVQAWVLDQTRAAGDLRPLSPDSIRQYLGEIRRAFAWGEIYPNPAEWAHLRIPRPDTVEAPADPPSLAEFEALLAAIRPKHRDALIVLEGTGVRVSEMVGLRWGDVDYVGGRLRVATSKTRAGIRFVPLLARVRTAIEAQAAPEDRDPSGRVFAGVTDHSMRGALRQASKWAGVRAFSPHDFRHRFTTLAQLAGIPAPNVQQLVGHSKLSTTHDVYTHSLLSEPEERLTELRQAWARMVGVDERPNRRGTQVGPGTTASEENPASSRADEGDGGYRARSSARLTSPPSRSGSARMEGRTDAPE